ncbi:MAG: UDP-N-acetylglucosamine--N-acetylmuramyl-(pentapeptide) pyrophosphoryl-undecaprenol N-acetylglucosamine transferase [Chloroflexota bacterium]|nr:UDP-N-acetylglucosamine--N-acetylmuramyl-(pentapeptide) pyrophosphoryl-undecaprenol N-acetylglucosamine transferase [Chloroflexota bacterium]
MTSASRPLRIVIAGGGTGGHVLPAAAVIEELRLREQPFEGLWIGSHKGVERGVAGTNDIPFIAIQSGKLRRYVAVQTLTDALRIPVGIAQAWWHVRAFRPDVIYSTGGAVSVPTVVAGNRTAPVLTHEQTAQIGIANKTAARFAKTFAVGFEETAILARQQHTNVVVTGNPVRSSLKNGSSERGRKFAGFAPDLPVIYITGGALGASPLNTRVEAILEELLAHAQIFHQVGPATANPDFERLGRKKAAMPPPLAARYHIVDFVRDELPYVYAMADLVVARSGAGTISELGYLGLPSILMPLPGTWGDEQRKNARILGNVDAAIVIDQADATPERLRHEILALIDAPERRAAMSTAAQSTSRPDAAARLVDELLKLANDR